jgi:uncharacterized protein (DUF58 family)
MGLRKGARMDANYKRMAKEAIITTLILGAALLLCLLSVVFRRYGDFTLAISAAITALILAVVGGIYIVPKLSRRINLRLSSWNFSYNITQETAFFLILTVVVGFSAVNTGNNLLYLVFSVLLAILIASGVVSEASLRNLDISLRFPEHIFATQETLLELSVVNQKFLFPSFSLTVGVILDVVAGDKKQLNERVREIFASNEKVKTLGKLAYYAVLPARGRINQRITYTFAQRGSHTIDGFFISTKFPFGFLRKTQRKQATGQVIIYPELHPLGSLLTVLPALGGMLENNQRGNSTDLYSLRPYIAGDPMRRIDWKATAKVQQLMVREYTSEDERRFSIIFDEGFDSFDPALMEKFERGVILAASLADYFVNQQCEVSFLTLEEQLDFAAGKEHFYQILRRLALVQPLVVETGQSTLATPIAQLLKTTQGDVKYLLTARNWSSLGNNKITVINFQDL